MNPYSLPPITIILRGFDTPQVLTIAEQLVGTRLNSVEVALNSPHAYETISRLTREFSDELHVGAGTVTSLDRCERAIEAGATFLLSPVMFDEPIFEAARAAGVLTVPSAFSPSEIYSMVRLGADIVKVFPASVLGPGYARAIQAPLGPVPLMVVGGVNASNVRGYLEGGASHAGIGSGLFDPDQVERRDTEAMARTIRELEAALDR